MFSSPLLLTVLAGAMVLVTVWLGTRFLLEVFAWLLPGGGTSRQRKHLRRWAGRACDNRHCRHLNVPEANFCARCGQALRRGYWTGGR